MVHCVFRIKNKLNASSNAAIAAVKEPQTSAKTICRFYVAWRDNVAQCSDAAAPSGEKSSKLHSKFCRGPKACPLNALQLQSHYNGDWHVCDGLSLLFGRTFSFYKKIRPFPSNRDPSSHHVRSNVIIVQNFFTVANTILHEMKDIPSNHCRKSTLVQHI